MKIDLKIIVEKCIDALLFPCYDISRDKKTLKRFNVLIKYMFCSYQERWREVPYEARQPSMVDIEMVPIHTKFTLWEMRERESYDYAFLLLCAERHFLFY
jgi:hypothetical protein